MSVELTTLSNGLRIVTHEMPEFETASLGLWVNVGGRNESEKEHGISHFLEHMAFKGTGRRSAQEIAEEIETVGGDLNAATSKELTAYYARVLRDDVALGLEILGDIALNPVLDAQEFERERDVILQEISASKDCADDLVYDLAQDIAYPEQPLGRTILGSVQSVRNIQPEDIRQYMSQHYRADRIVVSAAGAVQHDQFVRHCETIFEDLPCCEEIAVVPARYVGGTQFERRPFEQSHLVFAFEGPDFNDERYYDALVFSGLMGGGMSSRLFQEVRERRGLCYSIYSFVIGHSDTGIFGIHAATRSDMLGQLLEIIRSEMEDVAGDGLKMPEIQRSKAQLKAGLLMGLESSMGRAEQMARQIFAFGTVLSSQELVEKVERVNSTSLRHFASSLLETKKPTLAIVGPDMENELIEHWWKSKITT